MMVEEKPNLKDKDFLMMRGRLIYDSSKSAMELSRERWQKDLDLYNCKFSEKERKFSEFLGTERLFIPKTYSNVQRIQADIMSQYFDDPEEIVDIGSYKNVSHFYRDAVKALLNYRLNGHPINAYQEFYEAGLDGLRNAVCVIKTYPKLRTAMVDSDEMDINELGLPNLDENGNPKRKTEKREKIVAYEPVLETIPPEDVAFSIHATWKDYWKYPIVHRFKRTRAEFKADGYDNVDLVSDTNDPTMGDQIKSQRLEDIQDPVSSNENIRDNQIVIGYEVWDIVPSEDGQKSGSYVLLGTESGPQVVGRGWEDNDLPLKFSEFEPTRPPIILGNAYPESHVLKGKSFVEFTESLQKEINAIANQEREAVARALRPHVYINREAEVDLMSLLNRRLGAYTQGNGPANNAITEIPSMNPMAISPAHRARVDQDYYENTSIPPNLLGAGSGEDTATGSTQQIQNANKKIKLVLQNLTYTAFLPSLTYLLRYEQTYVSDKFVNMVTGRMLGWVLPEDQFPPRNVIQGDFDIKINVGVDKQVQINKWLLVADRINQTNQVLAQLVSLGVAPAQQVQFKDPNKAFEALLPVLGLRNTEEWNMQAIQPPPREQVPGIASQPRNLGDASQATNNLNPQAPGGLNVIS